MNIKDGKKGDGNQVTCTVTNMEVGFVDLNEQWRVNSCNSKRAEHKGFYTVTSNFKTSGEKKRYNSNEDNIYYQKGKAGNKSGKYCQTKPMNIGNGIGENIISTIGKNIVVNTLNQNSKSNFNPYSLRDAEIIKNFKDGQCFVKDRINTPNSNKKQHLVNNATNRTDKRRDFDNIVHNSSVHQEKNVTLK